MTEPRLKKELIPLHDSSKRGKLRTCREVTGQVNHDRISAPLNDSRWSGGNP